MKKYYLSSNKKNNLWVIIWAITWSFVFLFAFLFPSCRTQYIPMPEHHRRDSTHLSVYTRADSIREYVSDSMSIRFAKGVVPAAQRGPREVQRVGCPQRYTVPSGRYTSEVSSAGGNGIPDTVYIDRWHTAYRDRWHTQNNTDTIRVTHRDTITITVPVEPPPRSSLALSERVRVLGKGCLIGGIGAFLLLFLLARFFVRR